MGQLDSTFSCSAVPWCVYWDSVENIEQNIAGVPIWLLISETVAPPVS